MFLNKINRKHVRKKCDMTTVENGRCNIVSPNVYFLVVPQQQTL